MLIQLVKLSSKAFTWCDKSLKQLLHKTKKRRKKKKKGLLACKSWLLQDISTDAGVAWFYQTVTLKEEQRIPLKDFASRKDVFALNLTGFGKIIAAHHGGSDTRHVSTLAPAASLELLLADSTGTKKSDRSTLDVIVRGFVQSSSTLY